MRSVQVWISLIYTNTPLGHLINIFYLYHSGYEKIPQVVSGWSVYAIKIVISTLLQVYGVIHEACTSLSSTQEETHKFILSLDRYKPN